MHILSNIVSFVALCVKTCPSCEISGEDWENSSPKHQRYNITWDQQVCGVVKETRSKWDKYTTVQTLGVVNVFFYIYIYMYLMLTKAKFIWYSKISTIVKNY